MQRDICSVLILLSTIVESCCSCWIGALLMLNCCPKLITLFINQAWISEMASYVKSIDRNHLLEAGLEGFYGRSSARRTELNPGFNIGTDFIANNRIPGIDFATVHSYPDQW